MGAVAYPHLRPYHDGRSLSEFPKSIRWRVLLTNSSAEESRFSYFVYTVAKSAKTGVNRSRIVGLSRMSTAPYPNLSRQGDPSVMLSHAQSSSR